MIVHLRRFLKVTATQIGTQIGMPASNGPTSPLISRNSSMLNCGLIYKIKLINIYRHMIFYNR